MQKVVFRQCVQHSPNWQELKRLFQSEWLAFEFKSAYPEKSDPTNTHLPPVIVVIRENVVIGGLAYSHFQEPHQVRDVVWINAIYVDEKWRGQGIASELIKRAVEQMPAFYQWKVAESSASKLYACTNIPSLYLSLGWSSVDIETDPDNHVMCVFIE